MQAQHTPGTWARGTADGGFENRIVPRDPYGNVIMGGPICDMLQPDGMSDETLEANKRLVEAAPDLLLAAEAARYAITTYMTPGEESAHYLDSLLAHAGRGLSKAIARATSEEGGAS